MINSYKNSIIFIQGCHLLSLHGLVGAEAQMYKREVQNIAVQRFITRLCEQSDN